MTCVLGDSTFDPINLTLQLKRIIQNQELGDLNTTWTKAIKRTLKDLSAEQNLKQEYTSAEDGCSEFMLDVVWWSPKEQRAILGVECEWGNPYDYKKGGEIAIAEQVIEDFWKLLAFKAPVKLMIYSARDSAMRLKIHEELCKCVSEFGQHLRGEHYLFMEFSPPRNQCYRYHYVVESDGRVQPVSLLSLDEESERARAAHA